MTQKDFTEEYLIKAQENAIYFKDGNFPNMPLYQENDLKAAFNAGRESVVEKMPDLKWQCVGEYNLVDTPFGRYYIDPLNAYLLLFNGMEIPIPIGNTLEQTKQTANEDYKRRIKRALGL